MISPNTRKLPSEPVMKLNDEIIVLTVARNIRETLQTYLKNHQFQEYAYCCKEIFQGSQNLRREIYLALDVFLSVRNKKGDLPQKYRIRIEPSYLMYKIIRQLQENLMKNI